LFSLEIHVVFFTETAQNPSRLYAYSSSPSQDPRKSFGIIHQHEPQQRDSWVCLKYKCLPIAISVTIPQPGESKMVSLEKKYSLSKATTPDPGARTTQILAKTLVPHQNRWDLCIYYYILFIIRCNIT
jgi:hypothetical protein